MRVQSAAGLRWQWIASFLLCVVYALGAAANAAQVNLAWDPSPDPEAAGYTVHWGNNAGNYTATQDVGASLQHTVAGLNEGGTYFFAVTAYDNTRTRVSAPSNELTKAFAPTAAFGASPTSGSGPLSVSFQDQSTGTVSQWSWDFGDGTTSAARSPAHTYSEPGSYTVSLTVTGPGGSNTAIKSNIISVTPAYQPPVTAFGGSPTAGTAPLTVSFSDQSSGDVTKWLWNFGDGNTSTLQNPTHVYASPGAYTVSLQTTGPAGQDVGSIANYIVVGASASAPTANFSVQNPSGPAPLMVTLTDTSSGDVSSRSWNFGDGTTGSSPTAMHTYDTPGTYTVSLSVSGPGGSDVKTISNAVTVTEPAPIASFTASNRSGPAPLTVTFTDTSKGDVNSRSWNFGDGKTSSGAIAVYSYSTPGTYSVSLTVSGPGGTDTVTKVNHVTVTETPIVADFAVDVAEGTAPLTVNFSNLTEGDVTNWQWDFGDGKAGTAQFPTHIYQEPGTYTVALTASGAAGSDTDTKIGLIEVRGDQETTSGLVAAYGFENLESGIVRDASGNDNHGTALGAASVGEGRFGAALEFDGIDDWVTIADAPSLDLSEALTLEAWVRPTNVGYAWQVAVMKEQAGGASYYLAPASHFGGPAGGVFIGNEQIVSTTSPLANGEWSHLATTYDGNAHRLYVNGKLVSERLLSSWIQQSSGVLRIGGNSIWGEFFSGLIDEVRIYNRALTADEIRLDMERPVEHFMEFGEISIDHTWTQVTFERPFVDPIVVVKPISSNGGQPAVVRVRNIDSNGFELRIQEWEYLDGSHTREKVSYLVIERGTHELHGGTLIEAETILVSNSAAFRGVPFRSPFQTKPVLLSSVTTYNDETAVITRHQTITEDHFQVRLQEQENSDQSHSEEIVHYIAWEPSDGDLGNLRYEVGRTSDAVTHKFSRISFSTAFLDPPSVVADMQTQDGADTANLRWKAKDASGISIRVAEEQSKDAEQNHTTEVIGYIAISSRR